MKVENIDKDRVIISILTAFLSTLSLLSLILSSVDRDTIGKKNFANKLLVFSFFHVRKINNFSSLPWQRPHRPEPSGDGENSMNVEVSTRWWGREATEATTDVATARRALCWHKYSRSFALACFILDRDMENNFFLFYSSSGCNMQWKFGLLFRCTVSTTGGWVGAGSGRPKQTLVAQNWVIVITRCGGGYLRVVNWSGDSMVVAAQRTSAWSWWARDSVRAACQARLLCPSFRLARTTRRWQIAAVDWSLTPLLSERGLKEMRRMGRIC